MIKIISNLVPGKENDYMEHRDFEHEINRFLCQHPGYEINELKIISEELIAVLVKVKQYHESSVVNESQARYNHVNELIDQMESVIFNLKERL